MLAEQLPIAAFVRRAEFYLFREAPSAKDGGINAAEMVGGSDQEDVMLRLTSTLLAFRPVCRPWTPVRKLDLKATTRA